MVKRERERDLGIKTIMKWQEIPCPVSRLTIESEVVDLRLSLWMAGTTNSLADRTSRLHPQYSSANPWCHLEASTKWDLERTDISSRKLTGTGACLFSWVFLSTFLPIISSVQSLSRVRLCDPMNHSTPGLPVLHQLPEFTQTHVHWVGDTIQPSHPLSSPSPPTFKLSQHQDLFKWVGSSHQVAKVLEFQLQHQSFQWTPRTDLL